MSSLTFSFSSPKHTRASSFVLFFGLSPCQNPNLVPIFVVCVFHLIPPTSFFDFFFFFVEYGLKTDKYEFDQNNETVTGHVHLKKFNQAENPISGRDVM